ncbi:MAG: hypothetical protein ABJA78_18695, partial [Ferruginibacter sp.]
DTLYKKAHKAKSSAAVIQAVRLEELLNSIEVTAKKGTINDELYLLTESARTAYNHIELALKKYLKKNSG